MKTVEEQLQDVEQRLKYEKSRRTFERYQTVRLHLLGHDNAAIAVSIGRKESTAHTYLRQYRKQALDGLLMKFSPGPPEQLSKEQQQQLKKTICDHVPHDVMLYSKVQLDTATYWRLHQPRIWEALLHPRRLQTDASNGFKLHKTDLHLGGG